MTLEQLRIFIAVAEREHLTRASEALNLTQSAVSSAIAALEARYGTKLFDRIGRGIALTEAGRLFLPEARAVLARVRAAEQTLHDATGGLRGTLNLAASQTVANFWLPERLARFHAACPGLTLALTIGNTDRAAAKVLSGEADIAMVEGQVDDPRLAVTPLDGDRLVLIAPMGLNLPQSLTPADWAGLRFIVREPGSGTRHILEDHLAAMGLRLNAGNLVMELPSNEAVRGVVEAGLGVSLQSELVAQRAIRSGLLQGVDIGLSPRSFYLLRLKERSGTRAEQAFMDICKS
ncbi:LysR family transcriptional regulator [Asticcacaulis taihuensis]|jgi:DNA-binding transcriptional LysR family regulator|uniref:Transcriptional regulator, LysR family n=1 Tax=Asticcacaulis taihuensis TaxID=260084 RepID=A0A1G4SC19_9CAUL|nr:LysR family transcriptional regulator [Asticcacaulis taihuensis]SCW66616.1 transcriptional regulator, LysR family [Asticcacaulis taihuensis]